MSGGKPSMPSRRRLAISGLVAEHLTLVVAVAILAVTVVGVRAIRRHYRKAGR